MNRKRKSIPSGVRWKVFQRDKFRCTYCGACQETAELVIDHGDPFSKGGEDSIDNYVTACRACNAGKRDHEVIPKDASDGGGCGQVTRRGVRYRSQLVADWADALRHVTMWIRDGERHTVSCISGSPEESPRSEILTDFVCELTAHHHERVQVVVVPNSDIGSCSAEEQRRIRDASILGYREPTLILIGSPWFFYGFVVDDRHKGCPSGLAVDQDLAPTHRFWSGGWYPDEAWDFQDPRGDSDFGLRPLCFQHMAWHMSPSEAAAMLEKEARDGI